MYIIGLDTIIGRVEGVHSSYGPGGFGVGLVREGESGRKYMGGEKVPGPWGYLVGLSGVIDTRGGTAREWADAKERQMFIESVEQGDEFIVDGVGPLVLHVGAFGHLRLDPVDGN